MQKTLTFVFLFLFVACKTPSNQSSGLKEVLDQTTMILFKLRYDGDKPILIVNYCRDNPDVEGCEITFREEQPWDTVRPRLQSQIDASERMFNVRIAKLKSEKKTNDYITGTIQEYSERLRGYNELKKSFTQYEAALLARIQKEAVDKLNPPRIAGGVDRTDSNEPLDIITLELFYAAYAQKFDNAAGVPLSILTARNPLSANTQAKNIALKSMSFYLNKQIPVWAAFFVDGKQTEAGLIKVVTEHQNAFKDTLAFNAPNEISNLADVFLRSMLSAYFEATGKNICALGIAKPYGVTGKTKDVQGVFIDVKKALSYKDVISLVRPDGIDYLGSDDIFDTKTGLLRPDLLKSPFAFSLQTHFYNATFQDGTQSKAIDASEMVISCATRNGLATLDDLQHIFGSQFRFNLDEGT